MIGFYHIKDSMSVCYNQLANLSKNENVNTEILAKICKVFGCCVDDVMEFIPDEQV